MHLNEAKLCLDCEHVFSEQSCPYCASNSALLLSRILDREVTNWTEDMPETDCCEDKEDSFQCPECNRFPCRCDEYYERRTSKCL